jgi:hypothetical protein
MQTFQKSFDGGQTWDDVVEENEAAPVIAFLHYIMDQDPTAAIMIAYQGRSVTFRTAV